MEQMPTTDLTLSANALKVLESRYLRKGIESNRLEAPDDMFRRVSEAIARAELTWGTIQEAGKWEEIFHNAMSKLLFLPNSPTLMNAGTPTNQLSACFVLPIEDHLDSIFKTLSHAAMIQQTGGGTGFNFSRLRPKGDYIHTTGGTSSGPVSFMKIFDAATEHVKQGGKRRGANMGIMNIDHPDIEEFVLSKQSPDALRNFNISVGITNSFMHALSENGDWSLRHPKTGAITKRVKAKRLWETITDSAWLTGDPGLVFLDTINAANPTPRLGVIEATNPCGEVPLLPFEACNLASINLSKFIVASGGAGSRIDWFGLKELIPIVVRFLDDVIEINNYLIPETDFQVKGNRKIGLGIMGWAEALSLIKIPYDSIEAVLLGEKLMEFVKVESRKASVDLSRRRGVFTNWNESLFAPQTPIRNATLTSIAPTGTISIIADTSSSIEPFFALAYERRNVLGGEILTEINKTLLNYLRDHNQYSDEIMAMVRQTGTLAYTNLPIDVKSIFRTALEVSPKWHLEHQIAFQKFTDNAVSKTINLPETATVDDVDMIYKTAWKRRTKGITVFRYNAKGKQVLNQGVSTVINPCKLCFE
jgi:ribonucleoside-diphosphate reductase alpha chain